MKTQISNEYALFLHSKGRKLLQNCLDYIYKKDYDSLERELNHVYLLRAKVTPDPLYKYPVLSIINRNVDLEHPRYKTFTTLTKRIDLTMPLDVVKRLLAVAIAGKDTHLVLPTE